MHTSPALIARAASRLETGRMLISIRVSQKIVTSWTCGGVELPQEHELSVVKSSSILCKHEREEHEVERARLTEDG